MFLVISLSKVPNTDPQVFTLVLKDTENIRKGYLGRTEHGTETALREALLNGGMPQSEIDAAFKRVS
jgi:hypothetical protein